MQYDYVIINLYSPNANGIDNESVEMIINYGKQGYKLVAVDNGVAFFESPERPEWLRNDYPTEGITEAKFREFMRSYVKEIVERIE